MSYADDIYGRLANSILLYGVDRNDRTDTGTRALFSEQMKFALDQGFPILTTKKVHFKSVVGELLWMLSGSTSAKELREKYGVTIWDEWQDEDGELGPVYGQQWRKWEATDEFGDLITIDQIAQVQESLRKNPDSRRHIVSAWNVADVDRMKLPPCHAFMQFFSAPQRGGGPRLLHCHLYQRSADMFLGVPFNIASYALLTHMLAQTTGHVPGVFTHTLGDAHIYNNHTMQMTTQLHRRGFPAPKLVLNPSVQNIDDFKVDDIQLEGYQHHEAIKAPVAV